MQHLFKGMPRSRRLLDLLALVVLLSYAGLAWTTERGSGLDPVWDAAQARGTLRVAIDVGIRPFSDLRDGEIVGYDADLAQAIAERLGLEVVFVPTGFDGLYDTLISDRADLIASALPYSPAQGYRARFSQIYFDAGLMLLTHHNSRIGSPDDLPGRRVGVALGSAADGLARGFLREGIALDLKNDYETSRAAIADLRNGQLDAVIVDHIDALGAVQATPDLQIAAPLSSVPYVLALPLAATRLEAEVNRALEQLRTEGFLEELNRRWMRENL